MLKESQQLVRFENAPQQNSIITKEHRRCSRLKNQCAKYPPLNMWAQWVLESKIFTRAILFLTILNTIVLGIQSEVFDNMDPSLVILKLILNIVDWSIVAIFLLEILLKWIDDFFMFWKNNWNIFDFMVTILSILPEVIKLYQGQNTSGLAFMKLIRMCRILRTLKMFSKFPRYRVLVLAISAGIKDLFFIFLLLLVFAYIFAVTGIVLFQSYTDSDQPDLEYKQSFKDIPNSLTTLFIIFTMDHWYELMLDTWKVAELDKTISSLYIIIWLLISSFIFKNIFMGIMVNKFQAIRQDMFQEMQQIQIRQNIDLFRAENINR
ncbi:CTSR2 protein, partial [Amia calva]|nr:CTSR2 protein [Amia calva]